MFPSGSLVDHTEIHQITCFITFNPYLGASMDSTNTLLYLVESTTILQWRGRQIQPLNLELKRVVPRIAPSNINIQSSTLTIVQVNARDS